MEISCHIFFRAGLTQRYSTGVWDFFARELIAPRSSTVLFSRRKKGAVKTAPFSCQQALINSCCQWPERPGLSPWPEPFWPRRSWPGPYGWQPVLPAPFWRALSWLALFWSRLSSQARPPAWLAPRQEQAAQLQEQVQAQERAPVQALALFQPVSARVSTRQTCSRRSRRCRRSL